ncbi:MAG: hypothetical protein JNM76_16685 [Betaproteobacteria bacterium]|nr:hypothetical protein [Betaproteobacteria bacterium]
MSKSKFLLLAFLAMIPLRVHAEVMDKELSFGFLIGYWVCSSVVVLLLTKWKPWAGVTALCLLAIVFVAQLVEIADPSIREAMIAEAGIAYVACSVLFPVLLAAMIPAGLTWHRHSSRRRNCDA